MTPPGSSAAAGPWTVMLVLASAVSFVILCTVTVMHSRGLLAGSRGEDGPRGSERIARKRRVRRRSSQMNEFSRLKDEAGEDLSEDEELDAAVTV